MAGCRGAAGARSAGPGRGEPAQHRARRATAGGTLQAGLHRRGARRRGAPRAGGGAKPGPDGPRAGGVEYRDRRGSPPARGPAGAGARGARDRGGEARADDAALARGRRGARSQRRARRHRPAGQAAADARARRAGATDGADRRKESRAAAHRRGGAGLCRRLSAGALSRGAVVPRPRHRRRARHRGVQVRRAGTARLSARRHDGVDRSRRRRSRAGAGGSGGGRSRRDGRRAVGAGDRRWTRQRPVRLGARSASEVELASRPPAPSSC